MVQKMKVVLFCFSFILIPSFAFAQAPDAKAAVGANTKYEFHMSAGFLGVSTSSSQYDLGPGFDYKPFQSLNWLQLGGEVTYQKISFRGGSTTNLVIIVGPTVNMGTGTGDSFFLTLGFALKSGSTDTDDSTSMNPNGSGFCFLVGKRFPLSGNFSLRPSLGVIATGTTGMVFRPFAMSYFF